MSRPHQLFTNEWYHCFNRGTDRRVVFEEPSDYERFVTLLYTSNGTRPIRISDRIDNSLDSFLNDTSIDRGEPLVEIGAYSLMPTHAHIVLRQIQEKGISRFMQKIFTGYTMYFNLKRRRTGMLFSGVFKSKHIDDDRYLKQVIPYVLLNPAEIFEPHWKDGIANLDVLEKQLLAYPYSSLRNFIGVEQKESKILTNIREQYFDTPPSLRDILENTQAYYREHTDSKPTF